MLAVMYAHLKSPPVDVAACVKRRASYCSHWRTSVSETCLSIFKYVCIQWKTRTFIGKGWRVGELVYVFTFLGEMICRNQLNSMTFLYLLVKKKMLVLDCRRPMFTHFSRLLAHKDTLFKIPNSEILYPVYKTLKNHTLACSAAPGGWGLLPYKRLKWLCAGWGRNFTTGLAIMGLHFQ